MADEITVQVSLSRVDASNTLNSHSFPLYRNTVDQSEKRQNDTIKNIGTSEETFSPVDITTNGMCLLVNHDTTNYVEWGVATGDYAGKMLAGESAGPFRLNNGKTLYLKANTAACDVRIILYGT